MEHKIKPCIAGFNTPVKIFLLRLYLLFKFKKGIFLFNTYHRISKANFLSVLDLIPPKVSIEYNNLGLGNYGKMYYECEKLSVNLSKTFRDTYLRNTYFIKFINKVFKTNKFINHISKSQAQDAFDVVSNYWLSKLENKNRPLLLLQTPYNVFLIEHLKKFDSKTQIIWIKNTSFLFLFSIIPLILMCVYRMITAGITYRNKKDFKLYQEAVRSLTLPETKMSFLCDNKQIKNEEILYYFSQIEKDRNDFVGELRSRGCNVINIYKQPLNLKNGLSNFIVKYICSGLLATFIALVSSKLYLMDNLLVFYSKSIPYFFLHTNFNLKAHLSACDHDEIAATIVMNYFNCQNILYPWSDINIVYGVASSFLSHNYLFTWGNSEKLLTKDIMEHDHFISTGCIFIDNNIHETSKVKDQILFFDSSFSSSIHQPELLYIEYLKLIKATLIQLPNQTICLKMKSSEGVTFSSFIDDENKILAQQLFKEIQSFKNFKLRTYLHPIQPEILKSKVIISMGFNTPSTLSHFMQCETIIYDISENEDHPLAEFKDKVVFSQIDKAVEFIGKIVHSNDSVFNYIPSSYIENIAIQYGDKALNQLRNYVLKIIGVQKVENKIVIEDMI